MSELHEIRPQAETPSPGQSIGLLNETRSVGIRKLSKWMDRGNNWENVTDMHEKSKRRTKSISSKTFVKFYDHCIEQRLFSKHDCSIEIYVKGYRPILLRVYEYETRLNRTDANHIYTCLAIDMQISLSCSDSQVTRSWLLLLSTPAFVS